MRFLRIWKTLSMKFLLRSNVMGKRVSEVVIRSNGEVKTIKIGQMNTVGFVELKKGV